VVEIAAEPANFAATPLYAAQLPDAEAVEAATVIPPPARPAKPLEDWPARSVAICIRADM
jgi:hypothetical protein